MSVLDKAIEAVGSGAELARRIGVERQAIHQWKRARVPAERVLDIERATGGAVTREELRPDIYPPTDARSAI